MKRVPILIIACLVLFVFAVWQPQQDRDWRVDVSKLPSLAVEGDELVIDDLRTFRYDNQTQIPNWSTKRYNLSQVTNMYFVAQEFGSSDAHVHTMLVWEFNHSRYLWLSVEARKEFDEDYNWKKGLVRGYELMYVFADDADMRTRRTVYDPYPVYMYPLNITSLTARGILVDAAQYAQTLHDTPRWYNTLTSTCTTNLRKHANAVNPGAISWSYKQHIPGKVEGLLYDKGLINTTVERNKLREEFVI